MLRARHDDERVIEEKIEALSLVCNAAESPCNQEIDVALAQLTVQRLRLCGHKVKDERVDTRQKQCHQFDLKRGVGITACRISGEQDRPTDDGDDYGSYWSPQFSNRPGHPSVYCVRCEAISLAHCGGSAGKQRARRDLWNPVEP